MSSLESDLLQPEHVDDLPPAAPDDPPAQESAPADDDAAIEAQTIALPDGDKLVPLSALSGARTALRDAKAELAKLAPSAERATQLEGQITQLQGQISQMAPVVQAYQAYVQQQQAQPPPPAQAQPEDVAELESIARDFDFYKPDATLDLDKARRHMERVDRQAAKVAQRTIQPMEAQTTQERANYMLERAMATVAPNGMKADPAILRSVWARVDPQLASTPDGAKHLWAQALAFTVMGQTGQPAAPAAVAPASGRDATGKFVAAAQPVIPPPLHTPRAGGSSAPQQTGLSAEEQRFLKQTGMSEKDYLESASNMPGGRR